MSYPALDSTGGEATNKQPNRGRGRRRLRARKGKRTAQPQTLLSYNS